ncbi:MAG: hypothetical protein AB7S26_28935 [Sandaracinaceae bacterium]
MTTILVGIDGTGTADDAEYERQFARSFVHRICTESPVPAPDRYYTRGPGEVVSGSDTLHLVHEAVRFIEARYMYMGTRPGLFSLPSTRTSVLLTGYSRGAAAVVAVAQVLHDQDIPVKAMMLFDCVDRCPEIDTLTIPSNVDEVIHVSRDPRTGSRWTFQNSGRYAHPPTVYNGERIRSPGEEGRIRRFFGTHGAIGGVPWPVPHGDDPNGHIWEIPDGLTHVTYAQDRECADRIWGEVYPDLCRLGFL